VQKTSFALVLSIVVYSCSNKPAHEKFPVLLTLSPSFSGRTIVIEGKTDLPDGSQIAYDLEHEKFKEIRPGDDLQKVTWTAGVIRVDSGRYSHKVDLSAWPTGFVDAWVGFEPALGQPRSVADKYGKKGEYLTGANVRTIGKAEPYRRVEVSRTVKITPKGICLPQAP